eukprot:1157224-Pelagomonas_calceolata.AAC.14
MSDLAAQSLQEYYRNRSHALGIIQESSALVCALVQEMGAYRLYTVVPFLVKFIDNLTNIYVSGRPLKAAVQVH